VYFLGINTLKEGTDNFSEIAIGPFAMEKMTGVISSNIATSHQVLTTKSSGILVLGKYCMNDNTTVSNMICIRNAVAQLNTENFQTICIGHESGYNNGGTWNILIGNGASYNYTGSDTNNIIISHSSNDIVGESNTIRVGNNNNDKCFIYGIYGIIPGGAAQTVIIDSNG
jgi:hypothetical protein